MRDPGCPGLRLRVSPDGTKRWSFWHRTRAGVARQYTLGFFCPELGVAAARRVADKLRAQVALDGDPAADRAQRRAAVRASREAGTVADVAWAFDEAYLSTVRPSTARVWRHHLERTVVPRLGRRTPASLTPEDLAPFLGTRPYEVLRRMLAWAAWKGRIASNPCTAVRPFGRRQRRPRAVAARKVLTAEQLRAVLPRMPPQVLLCALTGVREHEARSAWWADLDLDVALWHVPADFTKADEVHLVPRSRPAVVLLGRRPRTTSPWVFPAATAACEVCTLPGHAGKVSTRLVREVKAAAGVEGRGLVHRLRDTIKTWCSERGVPAPVSELILGHVVPGIAGTYDHASYSGSAGPPWPRGAGS